MLSTPTNNFGLAKLLKNFVLIGESQQIEEVIPYILILQCSKLKQQFQSQLDHSLEKNDAE